MHDIFNLKNDKGLSELLRSKDPIATLLEGAIQETNIPDLFVLTSGGATSAATSLLYSNRMPELIQLLRTEFETILIDTPPMLQIPDARVLGRMVDRVVLVTRAGKTTRAAAMAARQRFSEDGTKMLGTILNDWNPKRSPNGYYGNYSGYYYGGYRNGYGNGYHRKPED
jgi:succinoglycan biosynthesis transport protein ExoP